MSATFKREAVILMLTPVTLLAVGIVLAVIVLPALRLFGSN